MAKTGVLCKLANLVQEETTRTDNIKQVLRKYPICIPKEYYSVILENNLLVPLLKALHKADLASDLERARLLELTLTGSRKRRQEEDEDGTEEKEEDDDDDDDNSNYSSNSSGGDSEEDNTTNQPSTKKKTNFRLE
jgi:hypothetical protein